MEYRNDLEAARLRINTLEAKLDESKAALDAREAELAECRAERDRLKQNKSSSASTNPSFDIKSFAGGFGLASFLAACVIGVLVLRLIAPPPPTTSDESEGGAQGKIRLPPPEPPTPKARVQGHVPAPAPEPNASATIVEGQTELSTSDVKSIDTIVQEARPLARECYKKETEKHPDVSGSVTVYFDIDASGKVTHAELMGILKTSTPWWSADFDACLVGVYRKLQFPATNSPKTRAKGTYFFSALDRML
jgi:hypothetical protein